jgi:hypothetical protein
MYDGRKAPVKTLLAMLEQLDQHFDCVLIDAGSMVGLLRKTILRAVDRLFLVMNNDAAGVFAARERILRTLQHLRDPERLTIVENRSSPHGFPLSTLKGDINRLCHLNAGNWCCAAVPYQQSISKWPGSGFTMYSQRPSRAKRAVEEISIMLFPDLPLKRGRKWPRLRSWIGGLSWRQTEAGIAPGVARPLPALSEASSDQVERRRLQSSLRSRPAIAWESFNPEEYIGRPEQCREGTDSSLTHQKGD